MTATCAGLQSCFLALLRPFKHWHLRGAKNREIAKNARQRCAGSLFIAGTVIALLILSYKLAVRNYVYKLQKIPPRSSTVDRSSDFLQSDPIPDLYERHTRPWRKYADLQSSNKSAGLTPDQSSYRFLVSSAGVDVGDGLGHRFLVVNYERILAHALNLSYVHRQARYGTLTAFNPHAVDQFFGWIGNDYSPLTRDAFLSRVCAKRGRRLVKIHCHEDMVFCKRLKPNGLVQHLVEIPEKVALCLRDRSGHESCTQMLSDFTKKHPEPHTLFYTPKSTCSWRLIWSNQRITRPWFFNRYWAAPRTSRMDPRYVNIALHIRRGDFLNLKHRTLISDTAYAKVVKKIVSIVSEEELDDIVGLKQEALDLKFKVHIYSEGKFQPQTSHPLVRYLIAGGVLIGTHDVNNYGTKYVSERGDEMPERYWERLFGNHPRISCDLHISEDTLQGLEQMIAADILVGSASALSVHIAAQLSRGIPFLPTKPPYSMNSNKTIRWDPKGTGLEADGKNPSIDFGAYFDGEAFREVWREYRLHIGADKMPLGLSHSDADYGT